MRRLSWLGLLILGAALAEGSAWARETPWLRLDGDNFTIISAISERETRNWATEFEQFHSGIHKFLNIDEKALRPVTVVLFRSQRDMRPFKPLENGRPADIAGIFVRSPIGNYIETAADAQDEQTRHIIFHEGVHWLTNVSDTPLPLWLDEGLAEVFSTFSVDGQYYSYGDPLPWHVELLTQEKLMPIRELMNIQHGSLLYNEGDRTSIFYAESWAFVHFLLFSGRGEERIKYNELVHELRREPDPDLAFKKVFGVDCAGFDGRLEEYLRTGTYSKTRIRFDRSAIENSFKLRRALPYEVNLAQSSLLTAVNRPAEALPRLRQIVAEVPGNIPALEAEGFAAYQTGDYDDAEDCFKKAANGGSHNYFVYSILGDSTLGIRPTTDPMIVQTIGGDVRAGFDYYERELALNAMDEHAYDNIASGAYTLETITPLDVRTLEQGARLFPGDAAIKVGIAVVSLRNNQAASGLAALGVIAKDRSAQDKDAAFSAQTILDHYRRTEASEKINDLLRDQDFAGAAAFADKMLGTDLSPIERGAYLAIRKQAAVEVKIQKAVDLANSRNFSDARILLVEANSETTDEGLKKQIQSILDKIPANSSEP